MKEICLPPLVAFIILMIGCSEDSTTGPENDDTYTLEGTETIGSAGGIIETSDQPEGSLRLRVSRCWCRPGRSPRT